MATRIDDWQHVLSMVTARPSVPGGLRLEMAGRSGLAELARLIEAEQTCCPFFSFAITIAQRGLALEVTAPTDDQNRIAPISGDPRTPARTAHNTQTLMEGEGVAELVNHVAGHYTKKKKTQ